MTQTHKARVTYCRRLLAEGKGRDYLIGLGYMDAVIREAMGE